ncbi:outer membrane autotransporter [Brucella endophytica]|uniref:Outer membrane autotransporter n=1 Tax=Brucella endophytica TaxID=1963359 RepID=A0A916SCE8_9HYPH|nr:autotransporter outer membrane beta-barrel domain-containing protein [Brucella endophytica]GGA91026.1 outer membrane autotransporter [Brucella endophytica]
MAAHGRVGGREENSRGDTVGRAVAPRGVLAGVLIAGGVVLGGGVTEAMAQVGGCAGQMQTAKCSATNATVTITPDGATITVVGDEAVFADNGHITGTNIGITATVSGPGPQVGAVYMQHKSSITLTGGSITVHGDSFYGVMSGGDIDGKITLTDLTVSTDGSNSIGLFASGSAYSIGATGVDVTTSGDGAHGAQVSSEGTLDFTHASTKGSINTTGSGAHGAYVYNNGIFTLAGSSITTGDPADASKGTGSHGIYATSSGAITLKADAQSNRSAVNAWGTGAYGVATEDAAGVSIADTDVTSARLAALYMATDLVSTTPQVATINNSVLQGVTGILTYSSPVWVYLSAPPPPITINLSNGSQINADGGNGNALHVTRGTGSSTFYTSGGLVTLNADATAIKGDLIDTASNVAQTNIALTGTSVLTGGTTAIYNFSLTDSTWNVTRSSDYRGMFTNSGVVKFLERTGDPQMDSSYKTITGGAYTTGGQILFNSFLGAGSHSDLLAVKAVHQGSAATHVYVKDSDPQNSGGMTTGDGIKLVDVTGQSPVTAFALGQRVAAGSYEYQLVQGGDPANGGNPNDGNWYLRVGGRNICPHGMKDCTLPPPPPPPPPPICPEGIKDCILPPPPPPPPPPVCPDGTKDCILPPPPPPPPPCPNGTWDCILPPPPPPPPPPCPDGTRNCILPPPPPYRGEVPLYWGIPGLAQEMGLALLGNLHDRVGDRADEHGEPATAWLRGFGRTGAMKSDDFLIDGPGFDYTIAGLQAGIDLYRREGDDGSSGQAGVTIGMSEGNADVEHIVGGPSGSLRTDAYELGGYWTHFGTKGWYLDMVVQGAWYQDVAASSQWGENVRTDGWGAVASVEGGYPFRFDNGWSIEPQAQLIYQHIALNDARDRYALIHFGETNQWHGRIGARVVKTHVMGKEDKPRTVTTWGRVNLLHDFGSRSDMTISNLYGRNPVHLVIDRAQSWAQLELGITGQLTDRTFAYASGDYKAALDGPASYSYGGRLGLKYTW